MSTENRISNSSIEKDSDGFQLSRSKKKKENIIGSRKDSTTVLKSANKSADIFIGNCDPEISVESISKYINEELKVNVLKCENLVTRYDNYN